MALPLHLLDHTPAATSAVRSTPKPCPRLPLLPLREGTMLTPSLRLLRPMLGGAMGELWIADDLRRGVEVVVKLVPDQYLDDDEARLRFDIEVRVTEELAGEHVPRVVAHGVATDGRPYLALELLEGEDLADRLSARGRLTPREVARVVQETAALLEEAHARGIVHRDIKPENLFLARARGCDRRGGERVMVLDFGVAKAPHADDLEATRPGRVVGTPRYMSPEQILGEETDERCDLWSLAVVAFEALTGIIPFDGGTVGAVAIAICERPVPRPSTFDPLLARLDAWFTRACARPVDRRFATAKELADSFARAVMELEAQEVRA